MYKRLLLVLAGVSLLAGCGGGGGGSSAGGGSGFNGTTTQATVTTSNARAVSADAYAGSQFSASVSGIAKQPSADSMQTPLLQQTAGILENSVKAVIGSPNSSAKVVDATAQNTVNGFSGSFSYTITFDQTTGAFNGTITFSQYKDTATSPSITGSMAFSGVYNQTSGLFTSLNISMSSLSGAKDGKSYSLAGSVLFNTSGVTKTVTMSVVLTDNVSGRTYWVKDYLLVLTGSTLTMIGTYYDPIHGFVVISTAVPLTVSTIDAMPSAGQLLFTGVNNTKARLTFTGGGVFSVEADTTGNGTYVVVP